MPGDWGTEGYHPADEDYNDPLPLQFVGFLVGQLLRAGLYEPDEAVEAQKLARKIVEDWNNR